MEIAQIVLHVPYKVRCSVQTLNSACTCIIFGNAWIYWALLLISAGKPLSEFHNWLTSW